MFGNATTVGITVAQAFILVPLCLRTLGPELYGAWVAGTELLLWGQQLDAGLTHLLTQRVGASLGRDRVQDASRWTATCLAVLAAIGACVWIAGTALAPLVVGWVQAPPAHAEDFVGAFRLGLLASVALLVSSGVTATSRGMQQPGITTVSSIVGVLAGFLISVGLLLAGWGVWALATGLVARALVVAAGSFLYLTSLPGRMRDWILQPSRHVVREVKTLTLPMAAGSAGYLLANNSEILLVTTFFGPVVGLTYALTRRALDGFRSLVESIGLAAAPGFAHLVAAHDQHRARAVAGELLWLRLAASCLGSAMVIAVNKPFVELLFGREQFGGILLTTLLAGHLVAGGQAMLLNHLLRAAGQVSESAWLRVADAAGRLMTMAGGVMLAGPLGVPVGSFLVSLAIAGATRRRLARVLPLSRSGVEHLELRHVLIPLVVFVGGVIAASFDLASSFSSIALVVAGVGSAGACLLWLVRPEGVWPAGTLEFLRWRG